MTGELITRKGTLEKTGVRRQDIEQLALGLHSLLYMRGDTQMWAVSDISIDYETYSHVPYCCMDSKMEGEDIQGFHITLGDDNNSRGRLDLEFRDGKAEYRIGLELLSTTGRIPHGRFEKVEGMLEIYLS